MAAGDLPAEARIKPALKQAWTNIWPQFWWLLLFGFLTALASGTDTGYTKTLPTGAEVSINVAGGLLSIFVGIPLGVGLTKAHLAASRGEKPLWSDLGYAFGPRYWQSLGLGLLSMLIVIGGFILLIIPGIYLAVKLTFVYPRFIEDDLGPVDAIKASFADVTGRWWNVFGLGLMAIPLIIAGALALGVGVFVALVLIQQLPVVYWRALVEQGSSRDAATPLA